MKNLPNGVWPTMVTPFTDSGALDFAAIPRQVEWYGKHGVAGLFAVCQSSEMFYLSLEERVQLAAAVARAASGRIPVVASGHISASASDQQEEMKRIADTGVDGVVFVTNRFAAEGESDDVWIRNAETLLRAIPDGVGVGLYECPHPYKRLLSERVVRWCTESRRFGFLKDTCCDIDTIASRLKVMNAGGFKLFNANAATLLASLRLGAAGYSGVMANFQPDLYAWICREWRNEPALAGKIQAYLGVSSALESRSYPQNAKVYQRLLGVPISNFTRTGQMGLDFPRHLVLELEQFADLNREYAARLRVTENRNGGATR